MSGTSATTSDAEIARNPHQPEGWRRDGIATNIMVFLGRDTNILYIYRAEPENWIRELTPCERKEFRCGLHPRSLPAW